MANISIGMSSDHRHLLTVLVRVVFICEGVSSKFLLTVVVVVYFLILLEDRELGEEARKEAREEARILKRVTENTR